MCSGYRVKLSTSDRLRWSTKYSLLRQEKLRTFLVVCTTFCFILKTETEAKLLARPHACAIIRLVFVYFNVCDSAKMAGFNRWIILTVTHLGWVEGLSISLLFDTLNVIFRLENISTNRESCNSRQNHCCFFSEGQDKHCTIHYIRNGRMFFIPFEGCSLFFFFLSLSWA